MDGEEGEGVWSWCHEEGEGVCHEEGEGVVVRREREWW